MPVQTARPRALVVAYDFPPHAAIGTMRTLRVVRQLDARGWQVTVLTGHPGAYRTSTPVDEALVRKIPPGVHVLRSRAIRPWDALQGALVTRVRGETRPADPAAKGEAAAGSAPAVSSRRRRSDAAAALARMQDVVDAALAIPDQESGWMLPASITGLVNQAGRSRPDVIYSSAPPWTGHLVAAVLQQVLRRPWVADFRDPWARAPWREDRYRFAMRGARVLERFVVRRSDRIVFVAAANRDDFTSHYGQSLASKFEVVPNGCDPAEFDALGKIPVAENDPFVLLHAGSLYGGRRAPVPLLRAVATTVDRGIVTRDRFRLRFLGASESDRAGISSACCELGLEHVVEFLPRVPREQSLRAMTSASALLLLQPGHPVSVPGKVYEYLAAGRPVLAIAEQGEISTLIQRSGSGVSVRGDDESAIVDALAEVLRLSRHPVRAPREYYDGMIGATRIVDILETVANVNRPARAVTSVDTGLTASSSERATR